MKVIYLDVDGVLNHAETGILQSSGPIIQQIDMENEQGIADVMIEPECMDVLNELVERSGAKLILSSSWFHVFGLEKTERILKLGGLKHDLMDHTPRKLSSDRHHEISFSLSDYPEITSYVVIDDMPKNWFYKHKSRVVQTYMEKEEGKGGLLPHHIDEALRILDLPFDRSELDY